MTLGHRLQFITVSAVDGHFRRRGPDVKWSNQWSESDARLISLFEKLRDQGADWFGIVAEQQPEMKKRYPQFMAHIQRTCQVKQQSPDWVIYFVPPSKNRPTAKPVMATSEVS
jgi:hypothetical protein